MVVPLSIERRITRHKKVLLTAEHDFKSNPDVERAADDISELLLQCQLTLDQTMNAIWNKMASKREGKNKPNIYFPSCKTKETLSRKLQQYWLESLEEMNPPIFNAIVSAQSIAAGGSDWLEKLVTVTSTRHERDPEPSLKQTHGFGIGREQNLYIKEMRINNGQVYFDGSATNRQTGAVEPVRFEPTVSNHVMFEEHNIDALSLAKSVIKEIEIIIKCVFHHLPK